MDRRLRQAFLAALMVGASGIFDIAFAQQPASAKPKSSVDALIDGVLKEGEKRRPSGNASSADFGKITPAEIEAVRQKIRPCWFGPTGVPVVVSIKVSLSPDARPTSAIIGDTDRYKRDPNYKQAADIAYRTVMNPKCHPWPLAPEKYALWRTMTLNFDGRDY